MSQFNILIVEDELIIAEMMKEMLLDLKYSVAGIAKNYEIAIEFISSNRPIDFVILDVNLGGEKDGVDVGRFLNANSNIPFIYLTSYSDPKTVSRVAATNPAGCLLKPFNSDDLFVTIELIRARNYQNNQKLLVKQGRDIVKIDTNDIEYVKSDNNYLEVITSSKTFLLRNTLEKFLQDANDTNLVRTHRSYAVNIVKIDAIKGASLMIGRHKCPISRAYRQEILDNLESL